MPRGRSCADKCHQCMQQNVESLLSACRAHYAHSTSASTTPPPTAAALPPPARQPKSAALMPSPLRPRRRPTPTFRGRSRARRRFRLYAQRMDNIERGRQKMTGRAEDADRTRSTSARRHHAHIFSRSSVIVSPNISENAIPSDVVGVALATF